MPVRASRPGPPVPRAVDPRLRVHDAAGSAAVEFALALPFVLLALVLLLHAAVLGADVVTAQAVALQAARVAAVDSDAAVVAAVAAAAGDRAVDVALDPPDARRRRGGHVAARVRLRSAAFAPFGADVWIPARVTMRVESP